MVFELSLAGHAPEIVSALLGLLRTARPILRSEDDTRIRVLNYVRSAGRRGASQVSVARDLGMSDAALSRLCDELEQAGLIERSPHPHDRRVKMLHLTTDGETQTRVCSSASEAQVVEFVRTLSREEQDLLNRLVVRASCISVKSGTCSGCRVGGC